MSDFSILNNILDSNRVEKLVACVTADIADILEEPLEDDGYAQVLDKAMNANPGVRAISVIDNHALVEFVARLIVELEWQARQGRDNSAALHGLAVYLTDWLIEQIEEEDEEVKDEYENGVFEDELEDEGK